MASSDTSPFVRDAAFADFAAAAGLDVVSHWTASTASPSTPSPGLLSPTPDSSGDDRRYSLLSPEGGPRIIAGGHVVSLPPRARRSRQLRRISPRRSPRIRPPRTRALRRGGASASYTSTGMPQSPPIPAEVRADNGGVVLLHATSGIYHKQRRHRLCFRRAKVSGTRLYVPPEAVERQRRCRHGAKTR